MSAVTYDVARVPAGKAATAASAPARAWYVRFMDALIEARSKQAELEIARHAHLLPYSLDEAGNRLVRRDKQDMPFGGW
jgi:hypothetical protein